MKLQHNYTTVEQSKWLIDAGLPAETADCCLERVEGTESDRMVTVTEWEENYDFYKEEDLFPCWSLGRLIELASFMLQHHNEPGKTTLRIDYDTDLMPRMVLWFELNSDLADFSILRPTPERDPKEEAEIIGTILNKSVEQIANKQATCQNFQVRKFGDPCPIDNGIEVDIYNCTNCEHYFAPASKSIICKKVN